jgi:hypothetical protein
LMLAAPWSEPIREPEKSRFVNGVQHLDRCALSGRAMARSGLRMMPPFPSPSLKFRKAGFPRSGFKASISDRAFPSTASLTRRSVCLRPSYSPLPPLNSPYCAGETWRA